MEISEEERYEIYKRALVLVLKQNFRVSIGKTIGNREVADEDTPASIGVREWNFAVAADLLNKYFGCPCMLGGKHMRCKVRNIVELVLVGITTRPERRLIETVKGAGGYI